jgi:hypothetical protein
MSIVDNFMELLVDTDGRKNGRRFSGFAAIDQPVNMHRSSGIAP